MRSLKKRGPHVLDDLMTSYFPYNSSKHVQACSMGKVEIKILQGSAVT